MSIERRSETTASIALTDTLSTTHEFPFKQYAGGMIYWLAASSHTLLTFYAAHTAGGDYHALQDKNNSAVTRTTSHAANECMAIPDECFGAPFIKIVTDDDDGLVVLSFKT